MRTRFSVLIILMVALLSVMAACGGQSAGNGGSESGGSEWEPQRPLEMIVPFSAGGGSDILARTMSSSIEEAEEVSINVVNRPSGSGAAAYSSLLQNNGDPHYAMITETTGIALPITTDTPFHYSDFTPIVQIAEDTVILLVKDDSPYKSLPDMMDAAKQNRLSWGVTGTIGIDAIVTSLTEQNQGVKFNRVVFESGADATTALLADDIDGAIISPGEAVGQMEAGKVRALAVFADQRLEGELLASVPTAQEEGVNVSFPQFRGVFAAGEITDEERAFWTEAVMGWTETDSYKKYVRDNFLVSVTRKGQEFEDYLKEYENTMKDALE